MRKSEFIPIFLKFLGAAAEFGVFAVAGLFEAFLETPYKGTGRSSYHQRTVYYKKNLQNLKDRKLIHVHDKKFTLTSKGKRWAQSSYLRYIRRINPVWDRRWRVIIFDIPQELHRERSRFHQKLKSLGFFALQKSVLVFPYPCEQELGHICRDFGISKYVDILTADSIGTREEEIKKCFNL